jgi:hypothetical protein
VPDVTGRTVNPLDPIVTSGETPVTGARVVLYGPTGDSAIAVEDRVGRADHLGAGVYRVWTGGSAAAAPAGAFVPLAAGGLYRLRVTSSVGNADATTQVPAAERVVTGPARTVSLSRDSVLLGELGARAAGFVYALRGSNVNQAEGDAQFRRTLEPRLILPSGGDDWAFAYVRDRLRSGTRHTLTVTAVDSNYFHYYGNEADPFADRSQGTTLRGASGVVGSLLLIVSLPITVSGGP